MKTPSPDKQFREAPAREELLDWDSIDTVLLDMDGTLLDLNFDNHFWTKHVPLRFAEANSISIEQACGQIFPHMQKIRGTLNWYCIHYWSDYLALDIRQLKHQISHLVKPRPGIFEFLNALRKHGKLVLLATNAHQDTVTIKFSRVDLSPYFNHIFTSHQLEAAKEKPVFWARLQRQVPFDKTRSLLIDDNAEVLGSAREFGIRHLLTIARPDLEQPPQAKNDFVALDHFNQIMPENSE